MRTFRRVAPAGVLAAIGLCLPGIAPARAEAACTHRWTTVASPNVYTGAATSNVLVDVASAASDDAWAVGEGLGPGGPAWLLIHWDGHTWTKAAGPPVAVSAAMRIAIDGRGRLWIAADGAVARRSPTGRWHVFAVAASGSGLAVVSPTNVWVSTAGGDFLHWNGRAWTTVSGAEPGSVVEAIGRIPTGGLWAVGSDFVDATFAERWNGTSWLRRATPSPSPDGNALESVVASGSDAAVAVGETGEIDDEPWAPLILRWDGAGWTRVATPALPAGMDVADLQDAALVAGSGVWAVGVGSPIAEEPTTGLVAHITSTTVRFAADPAAAGLWAVAADPGRTTGWVVGDRAAADGGSRSLVQRACGL